MYKKKKMVYVWVVFYSIVCIIYTATVYIKQTVKWPTHSTYNAILHILAIELLSGIYYEIFY